MVTLLLRLSYNTAEDGIDQVHRGEGANLHPQWPKEIIDFYLAFQESSPRPGQEP